MSDQVQKILDKGSLAARIEDSIRWAKGRMCNGCRRGEATCAACVKAQETVDLLSELSVEDVVKPVVAAVVAPVAVEPKKPSSCEACGSGELLFDGESCEVCFNTRDSRGLKGAKNRFWDK